jgi:hypothetical protein
VATFTINITKEHPWHNAAKALDGPPQQFYYDTTGDENVAPDDALSIINHLNAFGPDFEPEPPSWPSQTSSLDELIDLLAMDQTASSKRRTR